ncbi:MAG TPA: hypothetical protein VIY90_06145 [Steroidobacteraceae bacterium]
MPKAITSSPDSVPSLDRQALRGVDTTDATARLLQFEELQRMRFANRERLLTALCSVTLVE